MATASYSFTRADAATLGPEWTIAKGSVNSIGIASNAGDTTVIDDRNTNYYSATYFSPTQFSKVTIGGTISANAHAVMVLSITSGSAQNWYGGGHEESQASNRKYRIWKVIAGTYTSLAETASQVMAAGDVVELQYDLATTTLTLIVNSIQILSVSDGSLSSGQPGLYCGHSALNLPHYTGTWTGGDLGTGDVVTLAAERAFTTNVSSYATDAFIPAASALLVAAITKTGSVNSGTMTDTLGDGGAWIRILGALKATSVDSVEYFVRDKLVTATSMTATYDCTGDAATGCIIQIVRVSNMTLLGSAAVRQSASQANQAGATTPAPVFGAACLTTNPVLSLVGNATNPAATTVPTGFTSRSNLGYATPTTGARSVSDDSGFTSTTVTWGGTSATAFASLALELDATAAANFVEEAYDATPRAREPHQTVTVW